ncbi:AAA family ATPase [Demequina sp. NBRC 110051]|uniref:AAA family ATPase n=1 Tax=Demequina sp. NBRC 110051 TaxID=1570340 RepID=UPI00117ED7DD|nr:AAA family ATPase [Demequina sp. NBRC 110051]
MHSEGPQDSDDDERARHHAEQVRARADEMGVTAEAAVLHARRMSERDAHRWDGRGGEEYDPFQPKPEPVVGFVEGLDRRLLPPGARAMLFGTRECLKSWLWLWLTFQLLRDGKRVLVLDYEMGYQAIMERLWNICQWAGVPWDSLALDSLRVIEHPPMNVSEAAMKGIARGLGGPPDMLVVDSIDRAIGAGGGNTNDDQSVTLWLDGTLTPMRDRWKSVVSVLISHNPKGSPETDDPIGSQRAGSEMDVLLNVVLDYSPSPTREGRSHLRLTKDRHSWIDVPRGTKALAFTMGRRREPALRLTVQDDGEGNVDAELRPEWRPDQESALVAVLRVQPGRQMTIEKARRALDIHPNTFTKMTDAMHAAGVILKEPRKGVRLPAEE